MSICLPLLISQRTTATINTWLLRFSSLLILQEYTILLTIVNLIRRLHL
jgi:hypothetical protein